jgi:hypothetical protein
MGEQALGFGQVRSHDVAAATRGLLAGRGWSLACSLLVLLCIAWRSESAGAAGSHTIVLLRVQGDAHVARRLRAELMALGWVVREVTPEEPRVPERSSAMGDVVKDLGALAVMRANPQAAEVELWVVHRPSTSMIHESVGANADDVLAVLAVEALRAKLLRLGVVGVDAAPTPSIPALSPEPPEPLVWFGGAPSLLVSPGGVGITPQALVGVDVDMSRRWSAGLWASLPLSRTNLDVSGIEHPASDAWVDASVALYGAHLSYRPLSSARWDASVGLGVTLTTIALEAHASSPWRGTEETLFAAGPVLSGALAFELVPGLRLASQLMLGSVFPRPMLEFEQAGVANWGRPFASAGLGLQVALPGVYR